MKNISLLHKNYFTKNELKKKNLANLKKSFFKILDKINLNLDNTKDTFHTLSKIFKFNFKVEDLKRFKKFNNVVIVGMGGSILGANAIYDFLKHKISKNFFFIDNLDDEKLSQLKKTININKTLFIIISKSGNTIETLTNFFSLNIIKKNSKNIIIISENKNNLLLSISKKFNLFHIEHKQYLGGRYSVLSEVGIVPAYLMGVNIKKLRNNLKKYLITKNKNFLKDSSIFLSKIIDRKIYKTIVFLNYAPQLEKFLFWCQQLIAESLGKKEKGFLPIISNVPKDHHSLLQLYIDGPKDKIFYIFSIINNTSKNLNIKTILKKNNFLNNKNIITIIDAQKKAVKKVLQKKKIPFREFSIKNVNEEALGELFSYFILETAIIGKMSKINPFNQPAVEQVKTLTKSFLSKTSK